MQIYLLEDRNTSVRIYAMRLGSVIGDHAIYSVYMDYEGKEWLHIEVKNGRSFLWPWIRVETADEYLEYINHI